MVLKFSNITCVIQVQLDFDNESLFFNDCHECHVVYIIDGVELEIEIGEFCGSELEEIEAPGYLYSINDTIIGIDTIPAGSYEVHCEEHGDHDYNDDLSYYTIDNPYVLSTCNNEINFLQFRKYPWKS